MSTDLIGHLRLVGADLPGGQLDVFDNCQTRAYQQASYAGVINLYEDCDDCCCDGISPGPWSTPSSDDAYWATGDCGPVADEFAGFAIDRMVLSAGVGDIDDRGRLLRERRIITVDGYMIGTAAGRRLGMEALSGYLADPKTCDYEPLTRHAKVWPSCTTDPDGDAIILRDVHLASPITFADGAGSGSANDRQVVRFTMQLTAEPVVLRNRRAATLSGAWPSGKTTGTGSIRRTEWCDFCCPPTDDCYTEPCPDEDSAAPGFTPLDPCFCIPWYRTRKTANITNICRTGELRVGVVASNTSYQPTPDFEITLWADAGIGNPADQSGSNPWEQYLCQPVCERLQMKGLPARSRITVDPIRQTVELYCIDDDATRTAIRSVYRGPQRIWRPRPIPSSGDSVWVAVDQDAEPGAAGVGPNQALAVTVELYEGSLA